MKILFSIVFVLMTFGCGGKKKETVPPIQSNVQEQQQVEPLPQQQPIQPQQQSYYNPAPVAPAPVYIQQRDSSSASDYILPWMMMNSLNNSGSPRHSVEHHYHNSAPSAPAYHSPPVYHYPVTQQVQASPPKQQSSPGRYSSGGSHTSKPSFSSPSRNSYSSGSNRSRYSSPSSSGSRYSRRK